MTIPRPSSVAAAIKFLMDRATHGPPQVVQTQELCLAAGMTEAECQMFTRELVAAGLLQWHGPAAVFVRIEILQYRSRMHVCSFQDVLTFARGLQSRARMRRLVPILAAARKQQELPTLTLKAVLEFGGRTDDGRLVQCVAVPWFEIMEMIRRDPDSIYQIDPFTWEELIAGAYTRAGFDEVILTPRSGDNGRDVIATKNGIGSIRIFDQVKAYRPGRLVSADEVRALAGTIGSAGNVSKGVVTTTSDFAPRIVTHDFVRNLIPYRLELKNRDNLLQWLDSLRREGKRRE